MTAKESILNIDTIEELTIFGLERSQQGLDTLLDEAKACAACLAGNVDQKAIKRLSELVDALHAFDLFEFDLFSLFDIERACFRDSKGDLESNAELFRKTLHNIGTKLQENDTTALCELLVNELSDTLFRFKELLPLVKTYVDKEYIQAENQPETGEKS